MACAVSLVVAVWRLDGLWLLVACVAALVGLLVDLRWQVVGALVRALMALVAHIAAALVGVVSMVGRRANVYPGWQPAQPWEGPSRSLVTACVPTGVARHRRSWLWMIAAVVLVDVLVGSLVHARFGPGDGLAAHNRFESSAAADAQMADIQRASQEVRFVPDVPADGVEMWSLSSAESELVSFDPVTGRGGFVPDGPVRHVALIGASSAFGLGATDEEAPSSELARRLSSAGMPTRVSNFAVPGFTAVQSVLDLERRLTAGERFDAVVLLAGFNDVFLSLYGPGGPTSMGDREFLDPTIKRTVPRQMATWWADRSLAAFAVGHRTPPGPQPLMRRYGGREHAHLDPDPVWATAHAAGGIRDALDRFARLGDRFGFVPVFAWTPSWVESPFEPAGTGGDVAESVRQRWQEVFVGVNASLAARSPVPFVDPGPLLYGRGCFFDMVHTVGSCVGTLVTPILDVLSISGVGP